MNTNKTNRRRPDAGHTLVELMIALLLTTLLLAGVGAAYLASGKSYRLRDNLARLQENGRYALELLQTDLRRAGYLGVINGPGTIKDLTVGGLRNGHASATDNGQCQDVNWVRMLSHAVFALNDHRRGYDCLPAELHPAGDLLVTRYAAPLMTGKLHAAQLYLRASPAAGTLSNGRQLAASTPTRPGSGTTQLLAHGYFIRSDYSPANGNCAGSPTIPALYRLSQSGKRLVTREVARGIEQFQVQFGIDSNNNGSIDRFIDAPAARDPRWTHVIAVRVWLLVRAECPETGYDNTHQYQLGNLIFTPALTDRNNDGAIDGDSDGDGNDDFRRQLFTGTVTLRNS